MPRCRCVSGSSHLPRRRRRKRAAHNYMCGVFESVFHTHCSSKLYIRRARALCDRSLIGNRRIMNPRACDVPHGGVRFSKIEVRTHAASRARSRGRPPSAALWPSEPKATQGARAPRAPATSGSMKSRIDPRVAGLIRGRLKPASCGLIRSRLDPVVAGSTRWRLDPALERVDPLAA